jgi:hypothetical protein
MRPILGVWFRDHIYNGGCNVENLLKQLYDLPCESDRQVRSYRGCIMNVNGVRFHTKQCEHTCTTHNSGIVV